MKIVFADYVAQEGDTGTNSFECAAWSEEIALTPGEHPIEGEVECGSAPWGAGYLKYLVGVHIPGSIVSDYFESLWCGMPVGKKRYDRDQNNGKPATYRFTTDLHFVARNIMEGKETNIKLRPGFEARAVTFMSDYDGKEHTYHGIFKKDA